QAASQEAVLAEGAGRFFVHAVELLGSFGLLREIDHLGSRALHLVRELVRTNASIELGIVLLVRAPDVVQTFEQAELVPLFGVGPAGGRLQMEQRRVALAKLHPLVSRW